ncbi:hypothetical protein BCR41DRAFT_354429 [Lobosporangium transversale]|uniref:Uncharacterized protein n=1 Tax=Lobosporangium transversale TaxID=64571 RepID=A0A1Y2GR98_9FUNG|nr:hypothetical protein BCR41DRAFT_354429 [Lobosporangium transversale]ORZ14978.1 hypothetical protein BCR41DRAFT_354429 [Lobosporangium transversale]|eukprot:XP_021881110.1 hypothetical protein BCR41DRAFT_354429 [Lobosporangium transversale]
MSFLDQLFGTDGRRRKDGGLWGWIKSRPYKSKCRCDKSTKSHSDNFILLPTMPTTFTCSPTSPTSSFQSSTTSTPNQYALETRIEPHSRSSKRFTYYCNTPSSHMNTRAPQSAQNICISPIASSLSKAMVRPGDEPLDATLQHQYQYHNTIVSSKGNNDASLKKKEEKSIHRLAEEGLGIDITVVGNHTQRYQRHRGSSLTDRSIPRRNAIKGWWWE